MNVVEVAQGWVGRWFAPGQKEQCALFVRSVFREARVPVGVAEKPTDWRQTQGLPQGAGFANSFAGDDVGEPIWREQDLKAGDILLFANTYGDYEAGTLTHVGIYVGGGVFVHRPTVSRPVERAALAGWWADRFSHGRRVPGAMPHQAPEDVERLKVFAHSDKVRVFAGDHEVPSTKVKVFVHSGQLGLSVNDETVDPVSITVQLAYKRR